MTSDQHPLAAGPPPDTEPAERHPDITVVVPTRDRPEMLRVALAAVAAQDYEGVVRTVVVFDNCEPDLGLARDNDRRPVDVVVNGRTTGLAGARNTGILRAATPLVAFCDDDDVWHPGRLAAQVEGLRSAPQAVLASCGIRVRYGDRDVDRCLTSERVELKHLIRSRLTELHPSTFLLRRRRLLEDVGLVDEDIPGSYAEDYEFLLRIARVAPIANVREVLVDVRWHQQSYFAQRWATIGTALRWLLERYPEFRLDRRGHARVLGQIAFAEAAGGHRPAALRAVASTVRSYPLEPRAALALAVVSGAVAPDRVLRRLHRSGRGL